MLRAVYLLSCFALLCCAAQLSVAAFVGAQRRLNGVAEHSRGNGTRGGGAVEAERNVDFMEMVGELGMIPHPGLYPAVVLNYKAVPKTENGRDDEPVVGKKIFNSCLIDPYIWYYMLRDISDTSASKPTRIEMYADPNCANIVDHYDVEDGGTAEVTDHGNVVELITVSRIDMAKNYLVTWTEAANAEMTSGITVCRAYTNSCFADCPATGKMHGMFIIENEWNITLSSYTTSDCSGKPAVTKLAQPFIVQNDGGVYLKADAEQVYRE